MIGPLALAAAAGLAEFLGAMLATAPLRFSRRAILYLFGMSGGYMLTWSVADLIPLLVRQEPGLVLWVLLGYFGLYVIENLFASHAHPAPPKGAGQAPAAGDLHAHALVDSWGDHAAMISPAACWAAIAGLACHGFLDGAAIVASFAIHPKIGALVFLAVFIHKIPEGSSLTSVLGAARQGRRVLWTAIGTSLITMLGGVAAWVAGIVEPRGAYLLLALSAGTFLFVGASNLIPATQKGESRGMIVAVLAGALLFAGVRALVHTAGVPE